MKKLPVLIALSLVAGFSDIKDVKADGEDSTPVAETLVINGSNEDIEAFAKTRGSGTDYCIFPNYGSKPAEISENDTVFVEYLKKCSNAELWNDTLSDYRGTMVDGRCYGITLLEILVHNGIVSPSDIKSGVQYLNELTLEEASGFVDRYHFSQNYSSTQRYYKWLFSNYSDKERIELLLADAEKANRENKYFMILYYFNGSMHAVAGIGVRDGDWEINGKHYDKCILTVDSNAIDHDMLPEHIAAGFTPRASIYVDSGSMSSFVQYDYIEETTTGFASIYNDEWLNRYASGITGSFADEIPDICELKINHNAFNLYDTIDMTYADGTVVNEVEKNYMKFGGLYDDYYYSSAVSYTVRNTKDVGQKVQFSDDAHSVEVVVDRSANGIYKNNSKVSVLPDDKGVNYDITVILNEGFYDFCPHYYYNISGTAVSDVTVEQTDKGMVVGSPGDIECHVETFDVEFDAEGCVSELKYSPKSIDIKSECPMLLFFSRNEGLNCIGADRGDVNGDGLVDPVDASNVLKLNADIAGENEVSEQTDDTNKIYDANGDGLIDPVDASLILVYNASLAEM